MSEPTLEIRLATAADMDEVMKLAVTCCEENGFVNASADLLAKEIYPALCQDHGLFPVIGEPGGAIEGGALLRIGAMWYSHASVVEERAIVIYPKFRSAKGGRARRLCEYSKHVADTLGIPLLIGVLSNTRTEGKVRMYKRIFGEPAGAFFLYGAQAVPGHEVVA
jgi:N-acetylglutamate synthase-like GNAT family acetyltransferase